MAYGLAKGAVRLRSMDRSYSILSQCNRNSVAIPGHVGVIDAGATAEWSDGLEVSS
jgi:hypothetical protein